LGCAGFVLAHPATLVITVTAGKPGPHALTDWDGKCGFHDGDDVVGARRHEDAAALKVLGARHVWLDFLDHQYGPQAPVAQIAAAIEQAVAGCDEVASPLGLGHDDHVLVAAACFEVARRHPDKRWVLYEDVIYRQTFGGTEQAIERLRQRGFAVEPVFYTLVGDVKPSAIIRYTSQLIGLGALVDDAYEPERYWIIQS
jgi:LmbE family N-acetylglucosaminyl deacetylase